MTVNTRIPTFDETVAFHGHACPGLALGYRVAQAAMQRLRSGRPEDEEFVAMVENDACGVDAVQFVCGCTFGKGNLVFRDHGKQAFTFYNRKTGEGIRLYAEPVNRDDSESLTTEQRIQRILSMPEDDFLTVGKPQEPMPTRARIFNSDRCDACGERVMETRLTIVGDERLCVSCRGE